MPNYEFRCKKCQSVYEEMSAYDPKGKYPKIKCPECKSSRKEQLVGGCGYAFTNPIGTDRWTSDGQGHDYRFEYNKPNVRKQREFAEKHSHVGPNPYEEIDDISSGKYFGEVK